MKRATMLLLAVILLFVLALEKSAPVKPERIFRCKSKSQALRRSSPRRYLPIGFHSRMPMTRHRIMSMIM